MKKIQKSAARFDNLKQDFLDDKKYSGTAEATLNGYRYDITRFLKFLSDEQLVVNEAGFKRYVIHLTDSGMSANSINHYIRSVKVFLYWCMEQDEIAPFKIKMVKAQETIKDIYTQEELCALIHRNYQILGSEIHVEVFDDRLEITSPGGMMNGRRVQDMDIRHIPSMRRNQVISDVFSRLGFMERRGSGIDRILNSYVEVAQKPTFYSDSDFFIVTLPNRSVATPAQVSMESVASGAESAETSAESAETSTAFHGMSTDAEVRELCERLDSTRLTASTKERTLELFKRYRYQYQFRSINVAQLYGVQKSCASSIIKNLIKHGLVTSPEYGVYQFVKK